MEVPAQCRKPVTYTAHDLLGPQARSGPGRGSWAGYLAPVALSRWTLTVVTPGAGMAQTPPYQVTDPATGEVTETFPFATDAEVAEALAAATEAFAAWRLRPVAERAAVVKRIAELFTERAADLAALITKEMGKRPAQAVGEAEFCTDIFNYYAGNGPRLITDKPLPGHDTARVEYRPVGPVLGVMPWNYPYYQVARFAAPNLIVGNTVILKHAENCPTSALAIAQIMKDAGVPDGVYVNFFATHEQVAAMIADPRLRGVSLTGSERAGTAVAETAGRNLKKVVLELGGSDPYIILDTDDVEDAAKTAWVTRMENVGQACNSNKRMIVMDDIYDDFVAALVKRATAMSPRQPGDDSPRSYSPMVSRKAAENLLAQVQDAVSKGATLHVGGTDIFNYYADNGPGLIADKPLPGHDTARVEYRPVGPVLGVMPWNYPYYQVARFAAPNLIAGNTVVLKHAENCPTSALAIAQIMKDAGVPDGVYVNLFATHEQVAAMIADPRLRGVSLTGSERAGTAVAETAGRNLKKVVLELGGSDPYIILDTDDVEDAAKTAWVTRMENVGQACNSNKRMIVMDDIYDDFVAALVKRATTMSPRQPGDDSPRSYSP